MQRVGRGPFTDGFFAEVAAITPPPNKTATDKLTRRVFTIYFSVENAFSYIAMRYITHPLDSGSKSADTPFPMGQKFRVGAKVHWKWLGSLIEGTVEEVFKEPVVRMLKGKRIKRNGSPEKPAYLVKSAAGNFALKLETELMKWEKIESVFRDEE